LLLLAEALVDMAVVVVGLVVTKNWKALLCLSEHIPSQLAQGVQK